MKNILLFLTIFCFFLGTSHSETIKATCTVKYVGNKVDERNFVFTTPPDSRLSTLTINNRPVNFTRNTETGGWIKNTLVNLSITRTEINFTEQLDETYGKPQEFKGQTYSGSRVTWIHKISRTSGRYELTSIHEGLNRVMNPDPYIVIGACESTVPKF